jgi:predicted dehydrogenase
MSQPTLRYAVIGAGGISAMHLNAIATQPGVEVVGISDPADPAQWRTPDGYGHVPKFADPAKLLRETKPDLVSICTPNKFHAELAQLAFAHGAHVACEKPMAMTLAEAEAMEPARARAGKHGGINFSYRNLRSFRFARELVARGDLGRLLRVNCVYLQSFLGAPAQPYSWRNDLALAGFGALGDLGVHMLDGVSFITGLDYQRVVGLAQTLIAEKPDAAGRPQRLTTDTNAAWLSELTGGIIATFETSQVAPGYGNFFRIELSGEGGTLAVLSDSPDDLWLRAGSTLTRYATWQTDLPKQALPTEFMRGAKPVTPGGIVRAIRGETNAEYPTFADGLRAQRVLHAIGESMKSQAWETIG